MSKYVLIIIIAILFTNCEYILVKPALEFIVLNKSDASEVRADVFIQDTKMVDSKMVDVGNPIQIASFKEIKTGEESNIISVDLEKFSETGEGTIYVLAQKNGNSDTLRNGAGIYRNFRNAQEFAPSRWKTIEIIINKPQGKKDEIQINLAYYKSGKYVESYGR